MGGLDSRAFKRQGYNKAMGEKHLTISDMFMASPEIKTV